MNGTQRVCFLLLALSLLALPAAAATCALSDERVTLRSEDVVPFSVALTAGACHAETTCGPEYASCASWSAYYDCNAPLCFKINGCGDNCEPGFPCRGPALFQPMESYRVCFNSLGQSCIQYVRSSRGLGCGC